MGRLAAFHQYLKMGAGAGYPNATQYAPNMGNNPGQGSPHPWLSDPPVGGGGQQGPIYPHSTRMPTFPQKRGFQGLNSRLPGRGRPWPRLKRRSFQPPTRRMNPQVM